MKQSKIIIHELKKALKEQGITYQDLAQLIQCSESTIKRKFSLERFDLQELEDIAEKINLSIFDLLSRAKNDLRSEVYQLTLSQERSLLKDMRFYSFFWMLVSRNRLSKIKKRFKLSDEVLDQYLTKLDRMKLIDYRGNFQFTLLIPSTVIWNENGPIEKVMVRGTLPKFLEKKFRGHYDYENFFAAKLTEESLLEYKAKFTKLAKEIYDQSVNEDVLDEDSKTTGVYIAFGPANFSLVRSHL